MNIHFKILYSTYYPKVYANCIMILKDPILAEEAAQDAFLKACEKLETLKEPSKFGAWVAMIAINHSKTLFNQNKRTIPIENDQLTYIMEEKVVEHNEPFNYIELYRRIGSKNGSE